MPSISTSTVSPAVRGPTPAGVPVRITSPASSVMTAVMNSTIVPQERAGRFQENDWFRRRLVAELLRMIGVVAADRDDLARPRSLFEKAIDFQRGAIIPSPGPAGHPLPAHAGRGALARDPSDEG